MAIQFQVVQCPRCSESFRVAASERWPDLWLPRHDRDASGLLECSGSGLEVRNPGFRSGAGIRDKAQ
jgi:hypothetical protein